ncbi:MAG: hypothetical protein IJZ38_05515 [Bacteroides sp.]|nr:hypothetical protein [Bacteroides sp.]
MQKNTNICVDLKTKMQEVSLLEIGKCYRGCITRDDEEHFTFEEEIYKPIDRHGRRNPKLFDGQYVSLVHMQNGKYQVHMRTIDASSTLDRRDLAFQVYNELLDAFTIID